MFHVMLRISADKSKA